MKPYQYNPSLMTADFSHNDPLRSGRGLSTCDTSVFAIHLALPHTQTTVFLLLFLFLLPNTCKHGSLHCLQKLPSDYQHKKNKNNMLEREIKY